MKKSISKIIIVLIICNTMFNITSCADTSVADIQTTSFEFYENAISLTPILIKYEKQFSSDTGTIEYKEGHIYHGDIKKERLRTFINTPNPSLMRGFLFGEVCGIIRE